MTGRDRAGASLAFGFLILLLGSEGALSLPDAGDPAAKVAAFYADHRTVVVVLQVVGFIAAALLGAYAWRLRRTVPWMARTGLATAVLACVPGVITAVAALVADPASPAAAVRWNDREPWGDRLLFLGVLVFAGAVAVQLADRVVVRAVAAVTALLVALRLVVEATGGDAGALRQVAPIAFLVLVGALGVLSARGVLTPRASPSAAGGSASAAGAPRRP